MTNIEFLVNELRKANETIAKLRKENAKVKAEKKRVMEHNAALAHNIRVLQNREQANASLGDLDALAMLKAKMEQG